MISRPSFAFLPVSRLARVGGFILAASAAGLANATVLTSSINMDNGFTAFISTSDSLAGTPFSAGGDWTTTITNTTTLTAGVDYYLHVFGYDQGGPAAFLGLFTLSGSDHAFSNNSTTLLTNTTDWKGNTTGFTGTYGAVTSYGTNGAYPWYFRAGMPAGAEWIWVGDNEANDVAYFTTKISAQQSQQVPDQLNAGFSLLLAVAGIVALRRRLA